VLHRRRFSFTLAAVLALGIGITGAARAGDSAQIKGRVCSPDGCGIQGVKLVIRDSATGHELRLLTGLAGTFTGAGLPPGTYEIKAEAPGFLDATVPGIQLAAGESRSVQVRMDFAAIQQVVTVVGKAPRGALQASEARESTGRDVGEALTRITGIWKIRKGGIANDVVMRGFAGKDLNVLIDGERLYGACPNHMDPSAFHVDFSEVERVEAAKGPFDIRNQGSLGGVLNVVTRNPVAGVHGSLVLSSGAYGYSNPSATFSWGGREVSVLGGFSYRRSRPYTDPSGQAFTAYANYLPGVGESSAFKAGSGWTRISLTPKPGHLISLSYTNQNADHVLYPYLQMDAVYDHTNRLNLSYEVAPSRGPWTSLRIKAYFNTVDHWMTDAFRLTALDKPRDYSMGTLARTDVQGAKIEADTHHWTYGLEGYLRGWNARTELAGMGYAAQFSIPDVRTDSLGGYADFQADLTARLSLAAGGRFDLARTAASASLANTDLYFAYHGTRALAASDAFPSGHLQLTYALAKGLDFEVGLGHTVRIPDARERYFALKRAGSDWVGNPDLAVSRNTGANVSLSLQSGSFLLRGDVYTNGVRDFITVADQAKINAVPGIMNTHARTYMNVDARISGAEVEGSWTFSSTWSLSSSLAYVRGTFPVVTETGTVRGNLPEMPPLSWRSVLRFDNGRVWGEIEEIVAARQSQVDTLLLEEPTAGHELLNARLGISVKTARISLGLSNVFNARFMEHLSYFRDPFRSGARVFEPGRNLFINVDYRF
jgi:iron complex outermembrane recepter protein